LHRARAKVFLTKLLQTQAHLNNDQIGNCLAKLLLTQVLSPLATPL
jgi:hypothetical protein